jgi:hypothetical protein
MPVLFQLRNSAEAFFITSDGNIEGPAEKLNLHGFFTKL